MKAFSILLALFVSAQAHATGIFSMGTQSGGPSRTYNTLPIYFDVNISENQAKAHGGGLTTDQTTMMLQTGVTFAVGGSVFFGATYDYRTLTQLSEVNSTDGSQAGKREFLAPVLGARFGSWILKIDYQTSGDYKLDRKVSGQDAAYASPKGYRGTLLVDLYHGVSLGLAYESVTYSTFYVSGSGATNLGDALSTTSLGASLTYSY